MLVLLTILYSANAKGENTTMDKIDQEIVAIIEELNCPYLLEPNYCEAFDVHAHVDHYDLVTNSELVCVATTEFEGYRAELYQGKNAYLALIVSNNTVLCAQYINPVPHTEMYNSESIYQHTGSISGSGIYSRTCIAYFMDGYAQFDLYFSPAGQPHRQPPTADYCIMSFISTNKP